MQSGTDALENTLAVLQKVKHGYHMDPRCIPKGTGNKRPHENLYVNVQISIIHNRQKVEQPKCPLSMDR